MLNRQLTFCLPHTLVIQETVKYRTLKIAANLCSRIMKYSSWVISIQETPGTNFCLDTIMMVFHDFLQNPQANAGITPYSRLQLLPPTS